MNRNLFFTALCCFVVLWTNTLTAQVMWQGQSFNADSLVRKAIVLMQDKNFGASIDLSRTVLNKYPDYVDFRYILALNYLKMDRADWALPYLQEVVAQEPQYTDAYTSLITAYTLLGDSAAAATIGRQAALLFPDYAAFQRIPPAMDFYAHEQQARQWNQEQQFQRALPLLDSLLRVDPLNIASQKLKIVALQGSGNLQAALSFTEQAIAAQPTASALRSSLSALYDADNNYRAAAQAIAPLLSDTADQDIHNLAAYYRNNAYYRRYVGVSHTQIVNEAVAGPNSMTNLDYGFRFANRSSVAANITYGRRKPLDALQMGLESYLTHRAAYYSYLQLGWSNQLLFPKFRAAYSLYRSVKDWQLDVGGRYLYGQDQSQMYTAVLGAGKYLGDNFIYGRGFFIHDGHSWNQAYSLAIRHYYKVDRPETFITFISNIGTSPDDPERYLYFNKAAAFKSYSFAGGLQHRHRTWVLGAIMTWGNYKISDTQNINQIELNLSIKKYF